MHIVSHLSVLLSSRYINVHTYIYKLTDIIVISPTSRSGCSSIFSRTMNFSRMNHSWKYILDRYSDNVLHECWQQHLIFDISNIFVSEKVYTILVSDRRYIYSVQEKKYCFHNCTHFVNIQSSSQTINSTVRFKGKKKKSLKNRSTRISNGRTERSSSFKNAWMKERSPPRDGVGSGARVREPIAIGYRDKWWNCCNMKGDIPKWSSRLWRQYVPLMWHAIALTMCSHIRYRYMCSGQWFFSLWSSLPFPAVRELHSLFDAPLSTCTVLTCRPREKRAAPRPPPR